MPKCSTNGDGVASLNSHRQAQEEKRKGLRVNGMTKNLLPSVFTKVRMCQDKWHPILRTFLKTKE